MKQLPRPLQMTPPVVGHGTAHVVELYAARHESHNEPTKNPCAVSLKHAHWPVAALHTPCPLHGFAAPPGHSWSHSVPNQPKSHTQLPSPVTPSRQAPWLQFGQGSLQLGPNTYGAHKLQAPLEEICDQFPLHEQL